MKRIHRAHRTSHRNSKFLIFPFWELSQPTLQREGDARFIGVSSKGGRRVELPPTFIRGKRRKNWKACGLRTLIVKGSGVVFTHREGISTPRVHHKGRQPLIKCAISWLQIVFYFSLFMFLYFYAFYVFLSFCGRQRCFPCNYVSLNCDEEIRPT